MKNYLSTAFAALLLAGLSVSAYATEGNTVSPPHRKVYCYFNNNYAFPSGAYGFSTFYLDQLDEAELIYPYGDQMSIYSGAAVDDVFYAYEYEYDAYMGTLNGNFISYDLTTGRHTELGTKGLEEMGSSFKTQGMTYDYSTGTMYVLGFSQGESALYKVNLEDGTLSKKAVLQKTLGVIAADMDGAVYGVGASDGVIYKINTEDGSLETVAETGYGGMMGNQAMEFDHSTGLLYWAANSYDYDGAQDTYMLRIDLKSTPVKVDNLGKIGVNSSIQALYIPFAEGGDDAPAAPSGFTAVPGEKGALAAILSWTAPATTFGGDELGGRLTGYVVERNGEKIATLPADATGYEDGGLTEGGECAYVVYATNEAGNGGKARANVFVGNDRPGAVTDMTFTVGDGCASAMLTWTAPAEGFNGGYFSGEGVTYKVVRQPDNKIVAEGLSGTSFTDKDFARLGRYSYVIYACNAYGETPASVPYSYVLGEAMATPVTQNFSDLTYFENQWMTYDGNDDTFSWLFSSEWGYYQFRDNTPCAEYIVNSGIEDAGNDADEWLVTPPVKFEAGKSYRMKLKVRCVSDESMELTSGSNNLYLQHEKFADITFKPVLNEAGDNWLYADYEVALPAGIDGVRCIGLHLVSKYPASRMSYLQISDVTIEEGVPSGISNVDGGAGTAEGKAVYSVDGRLVRADGSLDGLPKGIYIKGGKKYAVK